MGCWTREWRMDGGRPPPPPAAGLPPPQVRRRARFRAAAQAILRDPYSATGLCIYAVFIVAGLLAGWVAQYDPTEILMTDDGQLAASLRPSAEHWLGTTNLGRDIFSQLILGVRPSLFVGLTAAVAVATVGTAVGLLAGYFGGVVDQGLMRAADVVLGLPFLPFVIVLAALMGPSLGNIVLAVAILLWPNAARVIRAQVLTLMQRGFIEAARVTGAGHVRIMLVHVLPNILPLSFLYGSIAVGWAILTQASVAFLGFGDSSIISWGYMLQDAYASQALSSGQYVWFVPPGICIVLVVLAGFFLSRGYENLLFPQVRK